MCIQCTKLYEKFKCSCDTDKINCAKHWNYSNQEEWKKCINYYNVSRCPINIKEKSTIKKNNFLCIKYRSKVPGLIKYEENYPAYVILNSKSYVKFENKKYILRQFHFHNSSENTINNIFTQVECHFVHEYIDENFNSNILVIGLMLKVSKNKELKFVNEFFNNKEHIDLSKLNKLIYNQYYSFLGSLTVPPFIPYIKWFRISIFIIL